MTQKRIAGVTILGWLLFLPVIWYWGVQIKEWLGSKDYVVPFNWIDSFLPFGLPLSLAFIILGIGILRLNKLCRILAIVLNVILIVVFTCVVPMPPPVSLVDWWQGHYGLLYPLSILIILYLPKVKEQFKAGAKE